VARMGENINTCKGISGGNLKETDHLEYLGIDGMILNWILKWMWCKLD
jgi:hypothetical protein